MKEEHSFEQRCKEALRFFKKTSVTIHQRKECLYDLPAYLVVGPSQSGKTSFIAHSDVKFILEKKSKTPDASQYDFWVSQEAVWIDTPGEDFLISEARQVPDRLHHFIKILRQQRYLSRIKGVVVILNILDILHLADGLTAESLHKRLNFILSELKNPQLPVFILFNRCDALSGFMEFFEDLSREERFQPFGVPFLQEEKGVPAFRTAFHLMLHRLNNQLMWHLLHEKRLDQRFLMQQWVAQMTSLGDILSAFLAPLLKQPTMRLGGVFFTSATQSNSNDTSSEEVDLSSCQALMVMKTGLSRSFFTHDLMDGVIPQSRLEVQRLPKYWPWIFRSMMILLVFSVVAFSGVFLFKELKSQLDLINHAQNTLGEYKSYALLENDRRSIMQQLQRLGILKATRALLENTSDRYSFSSATNKVLFKLNNKADETYAHALQNILLPLMKEHLTQVLSDATSSPNLQYRALKSYLMLHDRSHLKGDDLIDIMQSIWAAQYDHEIQSKLISYLREMIMVPFPSIAIDEALVEATRKKLVTQDPLLLSSVILNNYLPTNLPLSLNLSTNKTAATVFTLADEKAHILSMYTTANFQTIYPKLIQQSAQEAVQGNWVLGDSATSDSMPSVHDLTQQLSDLYIKNYSDAWINFLGSIQLVDFKQLDQMNDALKILTDDHSPLVQLVQLVQANVADEVALHSPVLKAWNHLTVSSLMRPLNGLSQMVSTLVSDAHPEQKTFEIAALRMRNNGRGNDAIENLLAESQRYPEPLKRWINTLAIQTWKLILTEAQNYANNQWKQIILPAYEAQLQNRFPLNPMASEEVSLENFSYFFAPNGTIDHYYSTYIKPFVDSTQPNWKPKSLDGESFDLSNATLDFFKIAYELQHLYFANNLSRLSIPFTLQPIDIDDTTTEVHVKIGSQQAVYENNNQEFSSTQFTWPDEVSSNQVEIVFVNTEGRKIILSKHEAWGLLRLLQKANFHKIAPSQWSATFDRNGHAMIAKLTFSSPRNPLSLNYFKHLAFPGEIQ